MCPDKELLSAYCDGEIPSPWKEEIDSHLRECPACRQILARYRSLGTVLRDAPEPRIDMDAAFSRVREAVGGVSAAKPAPWKKRVSLPLAAVAAAALFFFGSGIFVSFFALGSPEAALVAGKRPRKVQNAENMKDMNQLLEVLKQQESGMEVTIRLPDSRNFQSYGKPVFLRAEELSGSIRQ
jgi:anti-sigma factor RsiW